jgi:hypothetical protein
MQGPLCVPLDQNNGTRCYNQASTAHFLTEEDAMANIPSKGFSAADPDDEIDLESLVRNAPPLQPVSKKETVPPSRPQPKPEKTRRPEPQTEEFDLASLPKVKPQAPAPDVSSRASMPPSRPQPKPEKTRQPDPQPEEFDIASLPKAKPQTPAPDVSSRASVPPIAQKRQSPAPAAAEPEKYIAPSADYDAETEYDHPVHRQKVRILPSFPTLILIIIVSIATAFVTGLIFRLSTPSLDNKMQEILSNQENTSVKVNAMEQTVNKLVDDMKTLQEKTQAKQAAPAAEKKHKAKAKPVSKGLPPTPETEETPAE